MNWLLNRLKERSTWLAIFTLAGLAGIRLEPELRELIINAILGVAAVVAFVFRENVRERSTDLDQSGTATPLPPVLEDWPIELMGRSESAEKRQADPTLAALDELISGTAFYRYRDLDDELAHPSKHTEVKPEDSSGWNG